MTVKDISNGPDGVIWLVGAVLVVISILMLSGKGGWLIAGYNTASEEEKNKYDEKKLSRVTGVGMSLITVMVFVMALFEDVLPATFVYIFGAFVAVVSITIIVLLNTICKNK